MKTSASPQISHAPRCSVRRDATIGGMDVERQLLSAGRELRSSNQLARDGVTSRGLMLAVRNGERVRVRSGWYVSGAFWEGARPEERHLAAIVAAQRATRTELIFSHRSAAVLHGLPAWSDWLTGAGIRKAPDPRQVHLVVSPDRRGGSTPVAFRHRQTVAASDLVHRGGFSTTGPHRTIADLARSEPFVLALACADAELHRTAAARGAVDADAWSTWRADIAERSAAAATRNGVRSLRALEALADPRTDSPLESGARLRLVQLGFAPVPQVEVAAPGGGRYLVDFELAGCGVYVECDGNSKYFDRGSDVGRSPEAVLLREKQRQNWITSTTGRLMVRLIARDVVSVERLASVLRACSIEVPGAPASELGPAIARFLARTP
ncbi:hypothetical protein ACWGOE_10525 [Leucobacter chromiiresistens]